MYIDKQKLSRDLTELMGCQLYSLIQQLEGKYPTEYDITKWKDKYQGRTNLPPNMVELNTFRHLTDQSVSNILWLVDEAMKEE